LIHRLGFIFQEERRFYRLLAVAGGITALLKGMHMPLLWAATQAQLDYRHGFLRRGLFGEICRQMHLPVWRYGVFSVVSFVLLACVIALLVRSVRRSGLDAAGLGAFTALLVGSFCISFLADVVGYYDIVMVLLVLLILQIGNPRMQLAAATAAGVAGVLVHESYAIAFLPVSLTGVMCWADSSERGSAKRWIGIGLAALLPWLLVLGISRRPDMTAAQGAALEAEIRARVDFAPNSEVFDVLTHAADSNRQRMISYMRAGSWWEEEFFGLLGFLPSTCFFLALAWRAAGAQRRLLRGYIVLSVFAPLLLNLLGYDRYRWLMMMSLNAAIAAIAVFWSNRRLHRETERPEFSSGWRRAAVFLLMMNLATDVGLFEGPVRNYPFIDYWLSFRQAKQEHRPMMEPPDRFLKPRF
jgi:hypothetical protein